jgi:hypothetical protein
MTHIICWNTVNEPIREAVWLTVGSDVLKPQMTLERIGIRGVRDQV